MVIRAAVRLTDYVSAGDKIGTGAIILPRRTFRYYYYYCCVVISRAAPDVLFIYIYIYIYTCVYKKV